MSELLWLSVLFGGASVLLGFKYYRAKLDLSKTLDRLKPILAAHTDAASIKAEAIASAELIRANSISEAEKLRKDTIATNTRDSAAIAAAQANLEQSRNEWAGYLAELKTERRDLSIAYDQARATYNKLQNEISLLEENIEVISFGVYKPHFTYETSEQYKARLEELWESDKEMIKRGLAVAVKGIWELSGSRQAGERMTKQYTKLMVRSFNAECDAAIAKVAWNNLPTMAARINRSFDALNQLGTVMRMEVTPEYRDLKLHELNLTHEMEEKRHEEREEARRVREQMREEERVQRELAAAEEDASREERDAEKELDKARKDVARMDDHGRAVMADRIKELESQLAAAQEKKERVKAQAELTKCGHVYVLSNAGSFGEEIVKIGMTRRLEPRERVAELGDASVPFPFDLHALIYTENAPALETELHDRFWEYRVNLANSRKEFFQVPLAEVEKYICERGLKCNFNKVAEAKEYRQTCSDRDRAKVASQPKPRDTHEFPVELFKPDSGTAAAQ